MDYFPLFARLQGTPCLIVGGGAVALRKARQLLRANAAVTVVAPAFDAAVTELAAAGKLRLQQRDFTADCLDSVVFVVAATDDQQVNAAVAAAAAQARVLCNVVDDRERSTAILPAVVDRSPVLIAVSSSGAAPVLATRLRQQLETEIAPRTADLARFMGKWRDAVRRRFGSIDERRRFWQSMLDSDIAAMLLDGDAATAEQIFAERLQAPLPAEQQAGIGLIVGAGPGDPELLTLKAVRALNTADVVLYDRLVNPEVLDYARKDAEFIYVGKQAGKASTPQAEINALLVRLVSQGKRVCRLKGGDPLIFGRGGEELAALVGAGLRWQIIPGITAASGCAAAAGIPLTHRQVARSLTYTTAQTNDGSEPDWQALAGAGQTAVFYMPVSRLESICQALIAAGRAADCPVALIENGSRVNQRTLRATLNDLPQLAQDQQIGSPALLIVGEVAGHEWPHAA